MNKKIILAFITGLAFGLASSFLLFSIETIPKQTAQRTTGSKATASIMIDSGENILICSDLNTEEGLTVFDLLNTCADKKNFELSFEMYEGIGVFITEIAGSSSDKDRYWQYWVNNEYAQISADNSLIHGGDVVMWKLTGSTFE
jgi:hypothetical protein